jgi:FkbM family methyltransferase
MAYTYDYYKNTCYNLKKSGFNCKNYLDIGSHNGTTANIVKDVWPQTKILLIEANEAFKSFYELKEYNYLIKLLGKTNGETKFFKTKINEFSTGNSIYKEISEDFNDKNIIIENKKIFTLDSITNDIFDFIKIDTQGSELDIIEGGISTIKKAKVIIVEISLIETNIKGCLGNEVIDILKKLKFDFISPIENIFDKNNDVSQQSILFIKP